MSWSKILKVGRMMRSNATIFVKMGVRTVFVVLVLGLLLVGGFLFFTHQYTDRQAAEQVTAGDYVDSSECASCHPAIYETFQHSGMGRSFARFGSVVTED